MIAGNQKKSYTENMIKKCTDDMKKCVRWIILLKGR